MNVTWRQNQLEELSVEFDHVLATLGSSTIQSSTYASLATTTTTDEPVATAGYWKVVAGWLMDLRHLLGADETGHPSVRVKMMMSPRLYAQLCRLTCLTDPTCKALVYGLLVDYSRLYPRYLTMMCFNQLVGRDLHQPGVVSAIAIRTLVSLLCQPAATDCDQIQESEEWRECRETFHSALLPALRHNLIGSNSSHITRINALLAAIDLSHNRSSLLIGDDEFWSVTLFRLILQSTEQSLVVALKASDSTQQQHIASQKMELIVLACHLHLIQLIQPAARPAKSISINGCLHLFMRLIGVSSLAKDPSATLSQQHLIIEQYLLRRNNQSDSDTMEAALLTAIKFTLSQLLTDNDSDRIFSLLDIIDDWLVRSNSRPELADKRVIRDYLAKLDTIIDNLSAVHNLPVDRLELFGRFIEIICGKDTSPQSILPPEVLDWISARFDSKSEFQQAISLKLSCAGCPHLLCLSSDSIELRLAKIRLLCRLACVTDAVESLNICKHLWYDSNCFTHISIIYQAMFCRNYTLDPQLTRAAIEALTRIGLADRPADGNGTIIVASDWIVEQFSSQLFSDNPHLWSLICAVVEIGARRKQLLRTGALNESLMLAIIHTTVVAESPGNERVIDALLEWLLGAAERPAQLHSSDAEKQTVLSYLFAVIKLLLLASQRPSDSLDFMVNHRSLIAKLFASYPMEIADLLASAVDGDDARIIQTSILARRLISPTP